MIRSVRRLASAARSAGRRLAQPRMYQSTRESWSQEGEDLILARFMEPRTKGFYVDVGAHDPFRFSNTAYFHARGWTGLAIEPDPDGATLIRRYRRKDVVVNLGVAQTKSEMTFFRFDEPALNTFSATIAERRQKEDGYKIIEQTKVPVDRLDNILSQHLPAGQKIDFMTVDAEGFDLEVLESNDWTRFRPEIVVAECFEIDLRASDNDPTIGFMASVGYDLVAKAANSVFFIARKVG
jgi:FkbM family methyltransferase